MRTYHVRVQRPRRGRRFVLPSYQITAAISGTATASINEDDIVAGGKTIIITLTGGTWVASGASFDAQRQNIINGLDSAQSELLGWDNVVKALQGVGGVVRTSNTVVTITLDAQLTYNITAQETITVTVPTSAILTSSIAVVGTPTFTVDVAGARVTHNTRSHPLGIASGINWRVTRG